MKKTVPLLVLVGSVMAGFLVLVLAFSDPILRYRMSKIRTTSTRTQVIELLGPPTAEQSSDHVFECIKGWDCSECKKYEGTKYRWVLEYQGWSAYWVFGRSDDTVLAVVRCGS